VTINGVAIPLRFVSDAQINAQAPWETIPGTANVVVTRAGLSSAPAAAQVAQFSPAIYGFRLGNAQAVAVNPDGTVTAPVNSIMGIMTHPGVVGETILLYTSGLGPVDNTPANGSPSGDVLARTTSPLMVLIGGVSAQVPFSGLAPQFTGVYQVNVTIPMGVTPGDAVPVQLMIGGVTSADALTIAVQ